VLHSHFFATISQQWLLRRLISGERGEATPSREATKTPASDTNPLGLNLSLAIFAKAMQ
jgi:hypothetical protein